MANEVVRFTSGKEEWRQAQGYELYEVSSFGRIRNKKSQRVLSPKDCDTPSVTIAIQKGGKQRSVPVKKLVYTTFIGEIKEGKSLSHLNKNSRDNNIANLKLVDSAQCLGAVFLAKKGEVEEWKPVVNWENYEVSSKLRMRNKTSKRVLVPRKKANKSGNAYFLVNVTRNKRITSLNIHREYVKAFVRDLSPDEFVDHIDRNSLNNDPSNLRIVSRSQNMANSRTRKGRKYKGIAVHKRRTYKQFEPRISKDRINFTFGYYHTEDMAALVYNIKAKELFGEYAALNEVPREVDILHREWIENERVAKEKKIRGVRGE